MVDKRKNTRQNQTTWMEEKGRWQTEMRGVEKITGMGRDWKRWRKSDHDGCSQWRTSSHCLTVQSCPTGRAPSARFREGEEKINQRGRQTTATPNVFLRLQQQTMWAQIKTEQVEQASRQPGWWGQRKEGQARPVALHGAACSGAEASCCQFLFSGRGVATGHKSSDFDLYLINCAALQQCKM